MEWLKEILLNLSRPWHESDSLSKTEKNDHIDAAIKDDIEIIAVITAAVAASLNRSTNQVIVRSIRHIPSSLPVWNRVGRQEQAAHRL